MLSDRLLVAVAAAKLDRELANGARQDASPALSRRARMLTEPAAREQLGRQLRRIVRDAHQRAMRGSRVPLNRERVLESEHDLALLASRLQSPSRVSVRGVAKVRVLLTDGCGPLFYSRSATDLRDAVREATTALS
jgi:hypothetical protein